MATFLAAINNLSGPLRKQKLMIITDSKSRISILSVVVDRFQSISLFLFFNVLLMAVKNTIIGWVLNFRVSMLFKCMVNKVFFKPEHPATLALKAGGLKN